MEWSPGQRGWGFLLRSPEDEELCLALFAYEGDLSPVRLILHIVGLYGFDTYELDRLIDYLEVTEGGYFELPRRREKGPSKREIAEEIKRLDFRLAWREDRWRFE